MTDVLDYWEPWHPQVGDRVTVRKSNECRACDSLDFTTCTGTVIGIDRDLPYVTPGDVGAAVAEAFRGHVYEVDLDQPIHDRGFRPYVRGLWIDGSCFAAIELEPLDDVAR